MVEDVRVVSLRDPSPHGRVEGIRGTVRMRVTEGIKGGRKAMVVCWRGRLWRGGHVI